MGTKRISQREARRLRKRVEELERRERDRLSNWAHDYPSGVNIATFDVTEAKVQRGAMDAAHRLGHALVAKLDGDRMLVYGVRL